MTDHSALIDEARVAGLFDTTFAPEDELDTVKVVEGPAGAVLILTEVEARLYAEVGTGIPREFADPVRIALERLGRLRATRLDDLRRPDAATMDGLRLDVKRALVETVAEYDARDDDGVSAEEVRALAEAYVKLGGDLDLDKAREVYTASLEREVEEFRDLVRELAAAGRDVHADDFPERLRPLVDPINALVQRVIG